MSDDYGRRSSSYDPSEQAELPTAPNEWSEKHERPSVSEKPQLDSYFIRSDEARVSPELKVGLTMPEVQTRPMPTMSDGELYLRVGVPSGYQTDPRYQVRAGIPQHEHKDSIAARLSRRVASGSVQTFSHIW
jgi:hypothetical protein